MNSNEIDDWINAGRLAKNILDKAISVVKPGEKIINICEFIEKEIIKRDAKPAFPVNVSINNVAAHYTSPPTDVSRIPSKALVKLDMGVNLNGAIADTAITINIGGGKVLSRIIKANKRILEEVIEIMKDGIKVKEISKKIWDLSHELGYGVLVDLGGHELRRGILHAGLFIPNHPRVVGKWNKKLREGMIVAIEPFLVLGNSDSFTEPLLDKKYIYSLSKKVNKNALKLNKALRYIYLRFGMLPFALRWLHGLINKKKKRIKEIINLLHELEKKKLLVSYPVLVDHNGYWISQFEHTILIKKSSAEALTG